MSTKHPSQAGRRGNGKPLDALEQYLAAYERRLVERGYAATYVAVCKRSVTHLQSL